MEYSNKILDTGSHVGRVYVGNCAIDMDFDCILAKDKKSTLILKSERDKDNVNIYIYIYIYIYVYIDCIGEGESTSAIQCSDREIRKDKDLPPKLENSARVTGNQKIPISDNNEEDINDSHQTNIPFTHSPTYKNIAVQSNPFHQVSKINNNKHQRSSRKNNSTRNYHNTGSKTCKKYQ